MPLTRANVTVASRVMLPAYTIFFAIIGAGLITTPFQRLSASPMLRYADTIMSVRIWGALFVACALLMLAALARQHRTMFRFALLICFFSMVLWTIVAALGVLYEPVSYSAWAWPAMIAAACMATNRSLAKGERDTLRQEG